MISLLFVPGVRDPETGRETPDQREETDAETVAHDRGS
jgi:hypothetical protein